MEVAIAWSVPIVIILIGCIVLLFLARRNAAARAGRSSAVVEEGGGFSPLSQTQALIGLGFFILSAVIVFVLVSFIEYLWDFRRGGETYLGGKLFLILIYLIVMVLAWRRSTALLCSSDSETQGNGGSGGGSSAAMPVIHEMKWPVRILFFGLVLMGIFRSSIPYYGRMSDFSSLFWRYSEWPYLIVGASLVMILVAAIYGAIVIWHGRKTGTIDERMFIFTVSYWLVITIILLQWGVDWMGMRSGDTIFSDFLGIRYEDSIMLTRSIFLITLAVTYLFLRIRSLKHAGVSVDEMDDNTRLIMQSQDRFAFWAFLALLTQIPHELVVLGYFPVGLGMVPAILFWLFIILMWSNIRVFTESGASGVGLGKQQMSWPPWYSEKRLLPLLVAFAALVVYGIVGLRYIGGSSLFGTTSGDSGVVSSVMFLYLYWVILFYMAFHQLFTKNNQDDLIVETDYSALDLGLSKRPLVIIFISIIVLQGLYSTLSMAYYSEEFELVPLLMLILLLVAGGLMIRTRFGDSTIGEVGDETGGLADVSNPENGWLRPFAWLWLVILLGLILNSHYIFIGGGGWKLSRWMVNSGGFLFILYYASLTFAGLGISKLHSASAEMDIPTTQTPEEILTQLRENNEKGVGQYTVGEFVQAEVTFRRSISLIRQGISLGRGKINSRTVVDSLKMMLPVVKTNLSNSTAAAIAQRIDEKLDELTERVVAVEEGASENPVASKMEAATISLEINKIKRQSNKNNLGQRVDLCVALEGRITAAISVADQSLMGGLGHVTPIATSSPTTVTTIPQDEGDDVVSSQDMQELGTSIPAPATTAQPVVATVQPAAQAPQSSATTNVSARFRVQEMIARGGMATVFMATEITTSERVVWKQAHGQYNPLTVANQKLVGEISLLQMIRNPRIPQHIAHGKVFDEQGNSCEVLIEEFIEGGDLKQMVIQVAKAGLSLPLGKVLDYVTAICEPLEHMARLTEPVYHRDMKPHNIIIHPIRGPVLIDFGLAKMIATGDDVSITRGGSGTWTPPERDSGISGPFTDVWSLGKLLYFMLTNESPPAILSESKVSEKFAESGHPAWLCGLVIKACWPQHEQRIQSVVQFRTILQNEGEMPEGVSSSELSLSDEFTTWS